MRPLPKKSKTKKYIDVDEEIEHSHGSDVEDEEAPPIIDVASVKARIRALTKATTFEPETQYWLDTGYPDLNAVYGSRKRGLPYGKIYETSGKKHGGKTAIITVLAGMAQKDGAAVIYGDLEQSRDPLWAGRLGLNFEQVIPIYPKLVQGKVELTKEEKKLPKEKRIAIKKQRARESTLTRLQGAEEVFDEIEKAMAINYEAGFKKQFVIFDSIANIQTLMAVMAGTVDRNLRVNVDRAQFLSGTLPRWASLAYNYNAQIHFINQLRTKPGIAFGDPNYTPGGNAVPFVASVQVRVGRIKNGNVTFKGNIVGIQSWVKNEKNKAGAGSLEKDEAAFRIRWDKNPARFECGPVEDFGE